MKACLLSGMLLLTGYAKAQWAPVPVTADGMLNEWKVPLQGFDDRSQISYQITNDSVNLYLAISTMDERTQINIMRAGITLGVNINGKKQVVSSVSYPEIDGNILFAQHRHSASRQSPDQQNSDDMDSANRNYGRSRGNRQDPADVYSQLSGYMGSARIKGLVDMEDGKVDVIQHKAGIIGGLQLQRDTLNVEMVIPLARLGLTPGYTKKIAYTLTVNPDMGGGGGYGNRGGGGMRGPRVGIGMGMGAGIGMGGVGFGVPIGGFGGGGRRGMNGGGSEHKPVKFKQALAKPQ